MKLTLRQEKNSKLTIQEMDDNFLYLQNLAFAGTSGSTSETVSETVMTSIGKETSEPTGFRRTTEDSLIFFDEDTKTFTIKPLDYNSGYTVYVEGQKLQIYEDKSVTITNLNGNNHIFFDKNGEFAIKIFFNILTVNNLAYIANVRWNQNYNKSIIFSDERHGMLMDVSTHFYLHSIFGTSYYSGLNLLNFNIGDGSDDSHAKFDILDGSIFDEDIIHNILGKNSNSTFKHIYKTGTTWNCEYSNFAILANENGLLYNNVENLGYLDNVSDNNYVLVHIVASNDVTIDSSGTTHSLHFLVGQNQYNTISDATNNIASEMRNVRNIAMTPEYCPVATVIYQYSTSFTNLIKSRIVPNSNGDNYKDWRGHSFGTFGLKFIQ